MEGRGDRGRGEAVSRAELVVDVGEGADGVLLEACGRRGRESACCRAARPTCASASGDDAPSTLYSAQVRAPAPTPSPSAPRPAVRPASLPMPLKMDTVRTWRLRAGRAVLARADEGGWWWRRSEGEGRVRLARRRSAAMCPLVGRTSQLVASLGAARGGLLPRAWRPAAGGDDVVELPQRALAPAS